MTVIAGLAWTAAAQLASPRDGEQAQSRAPRSTGGDDEPAVGAPLSPPLPHGHGSDDTVRSSDDTDRGLDIQQGHDAGDTGASTPQSAPASDASPRFTSVDIFVDSGKEPLSAYQFELLARRAEVKIVGVEGGDHPAYASPPYYDPAALSRNRIIIAAFNTGDQLPTGKSRVARLHLQVTGAMPEFTTRLEVAGNTKGQAIPASIIAVSGEHE